MKSSKQRSPYAKQIHNNFLKTTASEANPNALFMQCTVFTCANPTQAHAGKGLSERYCRKCNDHRSRHGSAHCKSYTAAQMRPYLRSTERWLKANNELPLVKRVIAMFDALLHGAGKPEIASRMVSANAKTKAQVALARMRVRGIKPSRLLTIALATHTAVQDDSTFSHRGKSGKEWLHVQIARQAHRLAARYIPAGYADKVHDGIPWGFKVFPAGTGVVMRELGAIIDGIGEHLVDKAVPSILELRRTRFGQHASREPLANVAHGAKL